MGDLADLPPQMDGENNGKPYEQMDDLGVHHGTPIFGNTHMACFKNWELSG